MDTTSKSSTPDSLPELIPDTEVLRLFGGRFRSRRTLARSEVPGRVLISANRAAYRRSEVLAYLQAEEQRRAERLAAMQVRAAHAREARAEKLAAKGHEAELLAEALAALAEAATVEAEVEP